MIFCFTMNTNQKNIIISEGKRPIWQVGIGLLCYAAAVTLFIITLTDGRFLNTRDARSSFHKFEFSIILFLLGLRFSSIQNILFDIGILKFGKWKSLPDIEYISVFKQDVSSDRDGDGRREYGTVYNVNVWYQTSKHFTIYTNNEPEPALEMGKHIATYLKTNLLDATDPYNKVWIATEPAEVTEFIAAN